MDREKTCFHLSLMIKIGLKKIKDMLNLSIYRFQCCSNCQGTHFLICNAYNQTYIICARCRIIGYKFKVEY